MLRQGSHQGYDAGRLLLSETVFVLNVFYGQKIDVLVAAIEQILPFLGDRATKFLDKQRATLTSGSVKEDGKGIIALVWDIMLTVMISYFVLSLAHSAVNGYRAKKHKESLKKDHKSK